ncbi:MAG: CDP-alcohol phosphatidyltransferase family protein [Alphaproteobacteria bacterium]|nr:CDP-alcohol phosphatidyltransferase family protein [Alphaproteobacteria bacterium]
MAPPIHPNVLTAARLPLAPAAVAFLVLVGGTSGVLAAAVLALVLEITDLADGWIARRYGVVSDFGKLFDPFSDAFSRFTLFMGVYAIGHASLWMVLAIYYRDSTVAFIRSIAATRHVVVAARPSGKLKAVVQGVGTQVVFLALVLHETLPEHAGLLSAVPWWTMLVITLVTLASLVDYLAGNLDILRGAWLDDRKAS